MLSIQPCHLYSMKLGICPVKILSYPINCQAIRKVEVHKNQVLYATAIQECSTYRLEGHICLIDLHILNTGVEIVCFFDTNQGNDVAIIGVMIKRNSPDIGRICEQQECC